MLVEAIHKRIRYRWPDGEVVLEPGQPVYLPETRAIRLLARAKGRVRVKDEWLVLWRYVATLSNGVVKTDPRLPGVLAAVEACDQAFEQGDKDAFLLAVEGVATAMLEADHESRGPHH